MILSCVSEFITLLCNHLCNLLSRNICYNYYNIKRSDKEKGYLNIYCKENSYEVSFIRKYPAILVIPGGAYNSNSFREGEPVAIKFLSNNIQSFTLEYTTRKYKRKR